MCTIESPVAMCMDGLSNMMVFDHVQQLARTRCVKLEPILDAIDVLIERFSMNS
jgi:hypothetical protein